MIIEGDEGNHAAINLIKNSEEAILEKKKRQ